MIASTGQNKVVLLALLVLNPLSVFASSGDLCSRSDYGQPNYRACISLLYGSPPARKGIFNLDSLDHAFFLPYFATASDFTASQWSHQVYLPEIWANGESLIPTCVNDAH